MKPMTASGLMGYLKAYIEHNGDAEALLVAHINEDANIAPILDAGRITVPELGVSCVALLAKGPFKRA